MAHPTRTGDLVVFSYPPYQFDAETPGTLIAPSHFFGQHGYVPDVQDLAANVNMRATLPRRRCGHRQGDRHARGSIDLAPTLAYLLGVPEPQYSQGRVLLGVVKGGNSIKPISIVGLTDFHGQLESVDPRLRRDQPARRWRRLSGDDVRRGIRGLPGPGLLLAAGDNVGASPPNSLLLEDMPAIDIENAWGLDATSYGNHEFDYGVTRLLAQQARAKFPFLATNIVDARDGDAAWVTPSQVFTVNGTKVGVIGAELQNTPELVSAGRPPACSSSPRRRASRPSRSGSGSSASASRWSSSTRARTSARTRSATPPARRGSVRSSTSPTPSRARRSTR